MDIEPAEWNSIYNNNLTSMVRVSRRLAPLMSERQWGRIINMASTIGLMPDVNMAAYAVTKQRFTILLWRYPGILEREE